MHLTCTCAHPLRVLRCIYTPYARGVCYKDTNEGAGTTARDDAKRQQNQRTRAQNPNHSHRSKRDLRSTNNYNKPPRTHDVVCAVPCTVCAWYHAPAHDTASPKPKSRLPNTVAQHTHTPKHLSTPERWVVGAWWAGCTVTPHACYGEVSSCVSCCN